jgi:L-asparagine transporter-like permease
MTGNMWIRQFHRWVSIAFTVGVTVNIVVIFGLHHAQPSFWVGLMALAPLILLLVTGLYMFALPYLTKARGRGREG